MTAFDRFDPFERRIGDAIDEIAAARPPAYLDDILQLTARSSQRSRWTFPERWLPLGLTTRHGVLADGIRVRPLLLLGMLLLAAVAAAAVGSRLLDQAPRPLPEPFGPAANGLVAFSSGNDLYLGDPATGSSRLLAAGVGSGPVFDHTGTVIATTRLNPQEDGSVDILLTTTAGRSSEITGDPLPWPASIRDWSADGRWLLVSLGGGSLLMVASDGSQVREVGVGAHEVPPLFAPPATTSIWTDEPAEEGGVRPVRIGFDGAVLDRFPLVQAHEHMAFDSSPDGRRVAVGGDGGDGSTVDIVRLDGTIERTIDLEGDVEGVSGLAWAPDSGSLLVEEFRGEVYYVSIVDVDGLDPVRGLGLPPSTQPRCRWAPDGGSLLCNKGDEGWWIVYAMGIPRQMPWAVDRDGPSWQRLALEENP